MDFCISIAEHRLFGENVMLNWVINSAHDVQPIAQTFRLLKIIKTSPQYLYCGFVLTNFKSSSKHRTPTA